jgi:hypothetical protein
MSIQYSTTHRTNAMSDIATQVGATGVMKIFSGSAPANCGTADSGTLLATFACSATFGTASSGVLTVNAITNTTPASNVAGTAGYFRIYPASPTTTNAVLQGTCGTSGTDLIMSSTSIASGVTVTISSVSITAYGA